MSNKTSIFVLNKTQPIPSMVAFWSLQPLTSQVGKAIERLTGIRPEYSIMARLMTGGFVEVNNVQLVLDVIEESD